MLLGHFFMIAGFVSFAFLIIFIFFRFSSISSHLVLMSQCAAIYTTEQEDGI